jgi:hypothetical protein
MLVDSEYVGDWMASTYLPDGVRIDYSLALCPDGGYVWRTRHEGRGDRCERGTWPHDRSERTLRFDQSKPDSDQPQLCRVLQIEGMEEANPAMVLRWVALASRNLPVQFFRVHLSNAAD